MLEFLASEWNQVIRELERLTTKLIDIELVTAITDGDRNALTEPLQRIADSCVLLGLPFSASYAAEIIEMIKTTPSMRETLNTLLEKGKKFDDKMLGPADVTREVSILKKRIDDELKNRRFFAIPQDKARFYRCLELFGIEVWNKFQSARYDIEEAGTCFACSRPTACVFHLMRTMEVGLRTLGVSLNNPDLDPKRNPSWERILKPCDDELRKPISQRSAAWRQDDLFFSNATANLRAVKDAWRNPTLHVETNYDEERALEILNAVKSFMRHLAEKLRE